MALEVGLYLRDRVTLQRDEPLDIPSGIWSGSIVAYSKGILVVELRGAATRPIAVEAGDTIELRSLPLERIISKSDDMVLTVVLVPLVKYEIPYIALRKSYVAAKIIDPQGNFITPARLEDFLNVESSLLDADLTTPQSITLDLKGRSVLSVQAWSSAPTTYVLEASFDGVNWRFVKDYVNTTEVSDGFMVGMRYFRLRSDAAGVAGDKVSLVLQAAR